MSSYLNHTLTCGGIRFHLEVGYRWVEEYRPSSFDPGVPAHADNIEVCIVKVGICNGSGGWTTRRVEDFEHLNYKETDGYATWLLETIENQLTVDITERFADEWQERFRRHHEAGALI